MLTAIWKCDTCGGPVTAKTGVVEWIRFGETKSREARLVHHRAHSPRRDTRWACYADEAQEFARDEGCVAWSYLDDFLGDEGLTYALTLLPEFENRPSILKLIQRLHVKTFEEALPFLQSAVSAGVVEPYYPPGFYTQQTLSDVCKWATANKQRLQTLNLPVD